MPPAVHLTAETMRTDAAERLVAAARERDGWPLELERVGSILSRTRRLRLAGHDRGAHVLDPGSRERLARTVEVLGVHLDGFRLVVGDGPASAGEELPTGTAAGRIRREGLAEDDALLVVGTLDDPPLEPPDVAGPEAVDAAWERIERRLAELHPGGTWLRGPADEAELAALEAHVGARLPDALRRSLLRHDGQDHEPGTDEAPPFIADEKWLLTVRGIRESWDMWREIQADDPDDRYRPRRQLTFADDDSGSGLAVDLVDGRVFASMDTYDPWLVAPRYESWLALWADQLDAAAG